MNNSKNKGIEEIVRLMESDESVDAPADAIHWVRNLYKTRVFESKQSIVQKLVAALTIDLAPGKAAFGERSAAESTGRQLFFEAGDNGVDIRVSKSGKQIRLRGQILGPGFDSGRVAISSNRFKKAYQLNELGEFETDDIPAGKYSMTFSSSEKEIDVPYIELG
jgi:hypothetical protein